MNEPQRIRALRLHHQMTLQALADKIGTTKSQIDKLERGERRLTIDWLKKIADALNVSPAIFLLDSFSLENARETPQEALRGPRFTLHEGQQVSPGEYGGDYGTTVPPLKANHRATNTATPPPLPIFGVADPLTGHLTNLDKITSQVPCPPPLQPVHDAFAVYTPDDSLAPRLHMGELAYIHPTKPIVPGCYVLLTRQDGNGMLRRFQQRQGERVVTTAYREGQPQEEEHSVDCLAHLQRVVGMWEG